MISLTTHIFVLSQSFFDSRRRHYSSLCGLTFSICNKEKSEQRRKTDLNLNKILPNPQSSRTFSVNKIIYIIYVTIPLTFGRFL